MLCRSHLKNLRVGDSSVLKYKANKPESKLCNVLVVVIGSKVWKIASDSGFCGFGQKLVLPPTVLILTVWYGPTTPTFARPQLSTKGLHNSSMCMEKSLRPTMVLHLK